jgi:hypothetical protein
MKKSFILTAFISAILFSNISAQKAITDDGKNYTIEIPAGWVHGSSTNAWVSVFIFNDSVNVAEQLVVINSKNLADLSHAYKENKKAQMKLKNFKLLEEGESNISGEPTKWMVYTFSGDDGSLHKGKQYTIKKSGRGYILQFILLEPKFDAKKETFEKIIGTLKFN